MEDIQTAEIEYLDPLETYTAHIQRNGDGWVGWMPDIPEIECEESTQEELLITFKKKLHAVLKEEWEAWCKQVEEDIKVGKLDHLLAKADEDIRTGRRKDL